jgi:two-component system, sensor histidine kinase and response regulator
MEDREINYQKIVQQSPNALLVVDGNGRLIFSSDTYKRRLSNSSLDLEDVRIDHLENAIPSYSNILRLVREQGIWRGEQEIQELSGEKSIQFTVAWKILADDGTLLKFVIAQEDITQRRMLQAELASYQQHLEELVERRTHELANERERAEQASRAKSIFLANMSHEIRTPLNAVIGLAHLIKRDMHEAQQVDRIDKVIHAANHLLSLIHDVLDLSKIESGRILLACDAFSLRRLLKEVDSICRTSAVAKGLAFETVLRGDIDWVVGDVVRLRQVALNYIGNAIKFTSEGRITVVFEVEEEVADDCCAKFRLTVKDTGLGIPAAEIERLFHPFEQVQNLADGHGGTGLGLSINRRIAESMGGAVGVESAPGFGSTFWMTALLGIADEPAQDLDQEPDELRADRRLLSNYQNLRVLLAEDNEINEEITKALLAAVGIEVDVARNGQEAIDMAGIARHDLILMDMKMPVMDGVDATRAIRKMEALGRIPIIAMTANAFAEDREKCLAVGMNDFLTKPIDPDALYKMMLKWLLPSRTLDESLPIVYPNADAEGGARHSLLLVRGESPSGDPSEDFEGALASLLGRVGYDLYTSIYQADRSRFCAFLESFVSRHQGDFRGMVGAFQAGDLLRVESFAHDLKGLAGMLGMIDICESCELILFEIHKRPDGVGLEKALTHFEPVFSSGIENLIRLIERGSQMSPVSVF